MTKRKARKVTRRHLATLADQLPTHHQSSPVKVTLIGGFAFLFGALIGAIAGLAAAAPAIRKPAGENQEAIADYIARAKVRAKEFGERRNPPEEGKGVPA